MSKLERITVTVTEEMAAKLRAAVESGEYATTSEIVRDALRDWHSDQIRNLRTVEQLRAMLAAADASPTVDGEEFMIGLRARVLAEASRRDAL